MYATAIIAAGGRGSRFGGPQPKQLSILHGKSILQRSVEAFLGCDAIDAVVVVMPADLVESAPPYLKSTAKPVTVVAGGARRQDSVANAFAAVPAATDVVVIHDAARPLVTDALIRRTLDAARDHGAAIAAVPVLDTVKRADASGRIVATLPRDEIFLAQTPQAFRVHVLREALSRGADAGTIATDEALLAEAAGHPVRIVAGDPRNLKVTTPEDLAIASRLLSDARQPELRIGNGYDLHRLVPGRPLILGGVTIPFDKGLLGHSDADAVCHAVTDAVLGAAGAGDIGRHFPDADPAWKDANSIALLTQAMAVVHGAGYAVVNVDVVVIAQRPKLSPHAEAIQGNLASVLGCAPAQVSVKGKTNEGVDSMGAGESIAVHAVALLQRVPR